MKTNNLFLVMVLTFILIISSGTAIYAQQKKESNNQLEIVSEMTSCLKRSRHKYDTYTKSDYINGGLTLM